MYCKLTVARDFGRVRLKKVTYNIPSYIRYFPVKVPSISLKRFRRLPVTNAACGYTDNLKKM